jgi:hypothetical protein
MKSYQNVLRRQYTSDYYSHLLADIQFDIGFCLLKSDKLEMRIRGLKEVNEQVRSIKNSMKKTMNVKDAI